MNAPANITPRQLELATLAQFRAAVNAWADRVERKGSLGDGEAMHLELDVLSLGLTLWDDGDLNAALSTRCDELRIDAEGYRLIGGDVMNDPMRGSQVWKRVA